MREHGRIRRDTRQESEDVVDTHGANRIRLQAVRQHLFDGVRELHSVTLRDEDVALGNEDFVTLCVHLVVDDAHTHV